MEPIKEANKTKPLKELETLLKELPRLDDELDSFAADLEDIWKNQPPLPEEGMWE